MLIDVKVLGNASDDLQKIKASTKQVDSSTLSLEKQFLKLNSELKKLSTEIKSNSSNLDSNTNNTKQNTKANSEATSQLQKMVVQYLSVSTALNAFTQSIKDFSDLEQKTFEIAKTTGLAGAELKSFTDTLNKTSQEIRGMKLDSLYEISAIAGQLGVKGKKDLLEFTLEIQKIAKTSTLTAQQAGEGFAQLSNSLNEPIKNISRLTSTFTALASTTTANEASLLDYTQRLAGAGKTLELTSAQIAGIGATLKDVGITAEVGGTAISDVFLRIIKDGDKMAKRLGIDMEYFSKSIKEKPVDAVVTLLEAIGKLDKTAKVKALKDLKLSGSGLSSTLLKLSTNTDKLRKNIITANEAYARGTDATKEFDIVTKGIATTYEQFSDKVKLTSASIGEEFAPAVDSALRLSISLLEIVDDNKKSFVALAETITTLTVAWVGLNLAMKASPFGLVITGLTGIVTLAYQASKAIANVFEVEQRRAKLNVEYAKNLKSPKTFKDNRSTSYSTLIKKEKEYEKAIKATQNTLKANNNLNKKQKDILENNLKSIKENLKTTTHNRKELEKYYPELVKISKTKPKIKIDIELPKVDNKKFVMPIIPKSKDEIKKIKEIQREAEKAKKELQATETKIQKQIQKKKLDDLAKFARLEKERLSKVADFNYKYREATLSPLQFELEELGKQRKEWLSIGVDALKVQELYNIKAKEIIKEDIQKRATEARDKLEILKIERKKTEELKKQKSELQKFINVLGDVAQSSLLTILDSYSNTGDLNGSVVEFTQSGSMQDQLLASNNLYAQIAGGVGKALSGYLSSTIELNTNIGEENKSIANSLKSIDRIQNPQVDFLKKISQNTNDLVNSFGSLASTISTSKVGTGESFNESFSNSNIITGGIDALTLGLLGDDLVSAISSAFYNSSTKLKDSGIRFQQETVAQIKELEANSFQLVKETKSYAFGIISSSKDKLIIGDAVPQEVTDLVADSINLGVQNILEASAIIGVENAKNIADAYVVDIGDLSFKDKTESEINALVQGVLGNQIDNIAEAVAKNSIEAFAVAGEDYYSALIRVSTSFADASETLRLANIETIKSIDNIANTTGDIYAETIRESIVASQTAIQTTIKTVKFPHYHYTIKGGLSVEYRLIELPIIKKSLTNIGEIIKGFQGTGDEIIALYQSLDKAQNRLREIQDRDSLQVTEGVINNFGTAQNYQQVQEDFYQSFVSDADKLKDYKNRLSAEIGVIPSTKEAYLELVKSVDLSTKAGQDRYALLLQESALFNDLITLQDALKEKNDRAMQAVRDALKEQNDKVLQTIKEQNDKALQAKRDALEKELDSILKIKEAWREVFKSTRESLEDTIKSLSKIGKEENTNSSLVSDLIDYNRLKDQLKTELKRETPNTDLINSLNEELQTTSLNVGNNQFFTGQNALISDLNSLKNSIPVDKVQRVEIVNDVQSEKLDKINRILGGQIELDSKQKNLLINILEELEKQTAKA